MTRDEHARLASDLAIASRIEWQHALAERGDERLRHAQYAENLGRSAHTHRLMAARA